MAKEKCRYVATSFWDDEWIQTLDPSEKLLYLYLLTNPLTNIAGVYKVTIRRMCFDTGFNADTVGHILGKFDAAGKVYLFNEWLILPNWPKHQKIGKDDNNRKGIDSILKALPDDVYQFIIECGYNYQYIGDLRRVIQAPCKPIASPSNYINLNPNLNGNGNSKKNIEPKAPKAATKDVAISDPNYNMIKAAFEKVHGDFTNYAKEGTAIKRIIKLTGGDQAAIQAMIKTFFTLRQRRDNYWSAMPFTPSRLVSSGVWDGVKEEARKTMSAKDTSWIDALEKEAVAV